MDIFEELHKEHEEVAGLVAQLDKEGRDEKTFETLRAQLTAQSKAGEPEALYRDFEAAKSKLDG